MSFVLLRSSTFVRAAKRQLKKMPQRASDLETALTQLAEDPYHPTLRTHRLKGVLSGSYACSAGYDLRIIFIFVAHEGRTAILLQSVGTHDEVY
jgi:mRNA-degrading endonuclease YafQ of YafQ-DinJ toxin-antitoxin module